VTSDAVRQSVEVTCQASKDWSSPARLAAGQRWRAQAAIMGQGVTAALVEVARIENGVDVLDLASGEGDPALTLAALVGDHGKVTATDINPGPLEIAAEHARELGIQNIQFQVADAQRLPFESAAFERATCRFGAMYFPDPLAAMRETRRVLRPHGRVALAVWASIDQPCFQVFVAPLLRHAGGPVLPPEGPNPFRFAQPRSLSNILRQAGFREVKEERRMVDRVWTGSPEAAWEYFRDHDACFRALVERVPADTLEKVKSEIIAGISGFRVGNGYDLRAQITLATASV